MALLLVPAQTDPSQNFPADYQMHCDGRKCPSRPIMVDLLVHYPSLWPTISILHMFPRWGSLHESCVVRLLESHTIPSVCQWWYSHHLVLLYHLIHPIARAIEWLLPQLLYLIRKLPVAALSGGLQYHLVML